MYPQQQPAYYPPPPPAPKKRRNPTWLVVTFLIIAFGCLAGGIVALVAAIGSGDDGGGGSGSGQQTVGVNQPARDGKFEFTVTKVECGKPSIGAEGFGSQNAQGQYCIVTMTIKNIGDEPRTFSDTSQVAYGPGGVKYESDPTATIYLENANDYVGINPGNSVVGLVVFDIPKDSKIVRLELHDAALSGGVVVNL